MNAQQLTYLQETLKATAQIAEEFRLLLEEEKKNLTSLERDEITHHLEQKAHLVKKLSGFQEKILKFCDDAQIEPNYGSVRSFLFRCGVPNAESILQDWTQLKNALIKNQALNKTNEAILNELLRRNQIKQHVIRNLGKSSDTYGVNGHQHSHADQGWVEQV